VIRLFVPDALSAGASVAPTPAQAHYLRDVMRRRAGDAVLLFNGRDGEWRAAVAEAGRRGVSLAVLEKAREQRTPPDLELVVALVKRARLETIVEKAAELGARRVRLAITQHTQGERTNVERLAAIATEAAEQTGRLDAPAIEPPRKLAAILDAWPADRALVFCDEAGDAPPMAHAALTAPAAILIGPEGGFSAEERALVRGLPGVIPVSLGPRILRADTAAIAALALWQSAVGDWRP